MDDRQTIIERLTLDWAILEVPEFVTRSAGNVFSSLRQVRSFVNRALGLEAGVQPLPTAMPYVMNAAMCERWPTHVANRNSLVLYGEWVLRADPSWWVYRHPFTLMPAYWQTGDETFLREALSDYCLMPDVTQGQRVEHLAEIKYSVQHQLLKPYQDPEQDAEWTRRVLALAEHMKGHYRIGDLDQCLSYQAYFKIVEKYYGGSHAKADIEAYLAEYFSKVAGGAFDSSSAYQLSTAQLMCWGAAAYGKDVFPWFDRWATEFAEFCRWDLSSDLKAAAWWGDQGQTDEGRVTAYHRVHMLFLLAGLGYDHDGTLKSIAKRLMHETFQVDKPAPGSVYPYGMMGFQFVCDPGEIMAAQPVPLPDGGYEAEIGVVIWRYGDNFVQAYLPTPLHEDHHFQCYRAAAQQYKGGKFVSTMPGGYYPVNRAINANAVQVKHADWSYTGKFEGAEFTYDGFTAWCSSTGPWMVHFTDDTGVMRHPLPTDFNGVTLRNGIGYSESRDRLTYTDVLTVPEGPFPVQHYWAHYPVLTRYQHAREEIRTDGDSWVFGDRRLRAALVNEAGKQFPLTGKIEQRDNNWWRLSIMSDVDLPAGTYTLTTIQTPIGAPAPDPDPDDGEPTVTYEEIKAAVEQLRVDVERLHQAVLALPPGGDEAMQQENALLKQQVDALQQKISVAMAALS